MVAELGLTHGSWGKTVPRAGTGQSLCEETDARRPHGERGPKQTAADDGESYVDAPLFCKNCSVLCFPVCRWPQFLGRLGRLGPQAIGGTAGDIRIFSSLPRSICHPRIAGMGNFPPPSGPVGVTFVGYYRGNAEDVAAPWWFLPLLSPGMEQSALERGWL